MARKNQMRGSTRQQRALMRKKKRRKRAILITIELFILAILGVGVYGMFKLDKIDTKKLDENNLEAYHDTGAYTNVALFGLDSREGETDGGVQSDAMLIASINNKTSEVKLISVYRDTLLQQADGSYNKANSAYNTGGPEDAIALLNRNLDLDIKKYVSVNFDVMIDIIDALGGVQIDVAEEEISEINGYAQEIIKVTGVDSEGVFEPGIQTLNGVQATAYSRIRHVKGNTSGNDFGRTERQRAVLEQIIQKAQSANIITLNKLIDKVLPKCSTNFTSLELMGVAANAMKYNVGGTNGFPFDVTTSESVKNQDGVSFVVPVGFASNVKQLHEYLFEDKSYVVSDKVTEVSNDIVYLTGIDTGTSDSGIEASDTNTEGN